MIISALPSLQAEYKPLTSIRFFRHLCIALFGDKYLISEFSDSVLREFCDGNIYWTHYRKCYTPRYTDKLTELDDICANRYLKRELDELQPKLIVVFGNEIKAKVEAVIGKTSIRTIYKPFPDMGNEEIFDEVRRAVQPFMKYVKKTGIANKGEIIDYSNTLTGHEVHIRFEQAAFKRTWNRNIPVSVGRTLDEIWHKRIVVPNMERSYLLVSTFAFCENQIKTMLHEYFCMNDNYTILSDLRKNAAAWPPNYKDVRELIQKKWLSALIAYVSYEYPDHIECTKILCKKLDELNRLRNAIAHNGGLITSDFERGFSMADSTATGLYGIYSLAGFVFVTVNGIKSLDEIVDETADLLCKIQ